jgi:hypothetical protein
MSIVDPSSAMPENKDPLEKPAMPLDDHFPYRYGDYLTEPPIALKGHLFTGIHLDADGAWLGELIVEEINDEFTRMRVEPVTVSDGRIALPQELLKETPSLVGRYLGPIGGYRIHSMIVQGRNCDAVYVNEEGAWMGWIVEDDLGDGEIFEWVRTYFRSDQRIPAPEHWPLRIIEYFGPDY